MRQLGDSRIACLIPEHDRDYLRTIARGRNRSKDPRWTRRRSDAFSDEEVDEIGLYGEWAVGQYLDLPIDEEISSWGDSGHDFRVGELTLSVKFNHRWAGYLIVEGREGDTPHQLRDLQSDIIVSTHGVCNPPRSCRCRQRGWFTVALSGWLYRDEFLAKMMRRDWKLGPRHVVLASDLRPIQDLAKLVTASVTLPGEALG